MSTSSRIRRRWTPRSRGWSASFEQLDGHFNELGRELRWATDLDLGPLLPVDPLLAAYDPSAHVTEDLFQSKIGFVVLLNFPLTTLAERAAQAKGYTRRQWAEARLAGRFNRRVPAEVQQQVSTRGRGGGPLHRRVQHLDAPPGGREGRAALPAGACG